MTITMKPLLPEPKRTICAAATFPRHDFFEIR
jgi:hypothetical protein